MSRLFTNDRDDKELLTHDCDDEELAEEEHEVGDLVDDGEANDVAQDETEGREGRHTEVLAVHSTLQHQTAHCNIRQCTATSDSTLQHQTQ